MIDALMCKFNPVVKCFKNRKLSILVRIDNSVEWSFRSNYVCSSANVKYYNTQDFIKTFGHRITKLHFVFKDYTLL